MTPESPTMSEGEITSKLTIITSWVIPKAAVETPDHPPVPLDLLQTVDGLVAVPVLSLADPVPGVVAHATILHEAVDHVVEGGVLVAVGHLANVRTGRDSRFALICYALVAAC